MSGPARCEERSFPPKKWRAFQTKGSVMQHPIDATAPDAPATSPPAQAANPVTAGGQLPGEGREQGAPQEAGGTEQKAGDAPVHSPSTVAASQASAQQDRYDYDRTSIILVAHFRPVTRDGQP